MKTAVEWLIDEHFGDIENCTPDFRNKIEQAKELEKEQIVNAHYQGYRPSIGTTEISEKYYNETFKQQEQ
jgi:hypothetical protein